MEKRSILDPTTGRSYILLKTPPETAWGLGEIRVRYSVEQGTSPAWHRQAAKPAVDRAIELFERIGDGKGHGWKFRHDIPIRFEYSPLQANLDKLHDAFQNKRGLDAADRGAVEGIIDLVAILTFERTMDYAAQDLDLPGEDDGFAEPSDLPAPLLKGLQEEHLPEHFKEAVAALPTTPEEQIE